VAIRLKLKDFTLSYLLFLVKAKGAGKIANADCRMQNKSPGAGNQDGVL
jgi:hypothetical protein